MNRRAFLRAMALGLIPTITAPSGALAALEFDGVDDEVTYGDVAALNAAPAVSWSFWLKVLVFASQRNVVTKGAGIGVVLSEASEVANSLGLYLPTASARVYAQAGDIVIGEWAHWGCMFNGGAGSDAEKVKWRKNGIFRTATVFGTIPATFPASAGSVLRVAGNSGFLVAKVALFRMWTAALSEPEMDLEAFSYKPRRSGDLLLAAPYDDGTFAFDYSGNARHGTAVGSPLQNDAPPVSYGE